MASQRVWRDDRVQPLSALRTLPNVIDRPPVRLLITARDRQFVGKVSKRDGRDLAGAINDPLPHRPTDRQCLGARTVIKRDYSHLRSALFSRRTSCTRTLDGGASARRLGVRRRHSLATAPAADDSDWALNRADRARSQGSPRCEQHAILDSVGYQFSRSTKRTTSQWRSAALRRAHRHPR